MRPIGKPQTMMPESAAELAVSDSHENRHERCSRVSETPAAIPMMSAMNNGRKPPNHSVVCKPRAACRNGRAAHITAAIIHGVMIDESISGFGTWRAGAPAD
jgi:hypothetical protein